MDDNKQLIEKDGVGNGCGLYYGKGKVIPVQAVDALRVARG
jgi:hypothetical protein